MDVVGDPSTRGICMSATSSTTTSGVSCPTRLATSSASESTETARASFPACSARGLRGDVSTS
jgi:hypothetical protein